MSDYVIPTIAKDTWKRLGQWYGVDAISRKFGDLKPPPDWCMTIALIGKDKIDLVLAHVKTKYPNFLPSLPEFEQLAESFTRTARVGPNRPSTQHLLARHVLKRCALSRGQTWRPWIYLTTGNPHSGADFAVTGVIVPAADGLPAIRVMALDVDLDAVWLEAEAERVALERSQRQLVLPQLPSPTPAP